MESLRSFIKAMFTNVPYWQASKPFVDKSALGGIDDPFMVYAQSVMTYARESMPYVNDDKQRLMSRLFCDEWSCLPGSMTMSSSKCIFYALVHEVGQLLTLKNGMPVVRNGAMLRWRLVSLILGEDVLLAAYLAFRDRNAETPKGYRPATSVGIEDTDLNYLFDRGLSDLHQHLKASSDTFTLSWICLMNHVTGRYRQFKLMADKDNLLYSECYDAARIRLGLFEMLFLDKRMDTEGLLQTCPCILDIRLDDLQSEINICINCYAEKVFGKKIDYAISAPPLVKNTDDIHMGEAKILYHAFKKVYSNPSDIHFTLALYQYLIARTHLRKVLVQSNDIVGFGNFMRFEVKKDLLIEGYPAYKDLLIKIPCTEAVRHHVSYVETRIAPKNDYMGLKKTFMNTVKCCTGAHGRPQKCLTDFGIIFHFIKEADTYVDSCERNNALRRRIKHQSINIVKLRSNSPWKSKYLVGVDAANTELDCRPEVFAQSFRYLRAKSESRSNIDTIGIDDGREHSQTFHFTYHVGEDFYDLADGLRAIDEAVRFLHLEHGDRLGHCLALGTDAGMFYEKQHFTIPITRQCLIDNCVWMIMKAKQLNVVLSIQLESLLHETFLNIGGLVFPPDLLDIDTYYMSMMLRGDCPNKETHASSLDIIEDWDSFALDNDENVSMCRNNRKAAELYRLYHYDRQVRTMGSRVVSFTVTELYINAITEIQNAMMKQIATMGLVIECCPSSNWKIGMIDRYDEHPIFRFKPIYGNDVQKELPVTINTDDLGIFQTSLDFEYALLATAALKKKDANGNRVYAKNDVIRWLEEIRVNGEKYRFKQGEHSTKYIGTHNKAYTNGNTLV